MPTYDYACKECGHRFEQFQSMTDELLTICPACDAPSLQRLIGAGAGLLFKGSGFYLTDYKKTSSSGKLKRESTSASSGSSDGSASSESSSGTSAPSTPSSEGPPSTPAK
jgi:putative FmdB family regulatory protein